MKNQTHPLNKYFDSVNIITIPKRKQLMKEFKKNLEIEANLIDATLIKDIDYQQLIFDNFLNSSYYDISNQGRIACHLSQMKLL